VATAAGKRGQRLPAALGFRPGVLLASRRVCLVSFTVLYSVLAHAVKHIYGFAALTRWRRTSSTIPFHVRFPAVACPGRMETAVGTRLPPSSVYF